MHNTYISLFVRACPTVHRWTIELPKSIKTSKILLRMQKWDNDLEPAFSLYILCTLQNIRTYLSKCLPIFHLWFRKLKIGRGAYIPSVFSQSVCFYFNKISTCTYNEQCTCPKSVFINQFKVDGMGTKDEHMEQGYC